MHLEWRKNIILYTYRANKIWPYELTLYFVACAIIIIMRFTFYSMQAARLRAVDNNYYLEKMSCCFNNIVLFIPKQFIHKNEK